MGMRGCNDWSDESTQPQRAQHQSPCCSMIGCSLIGQTQRKQKVDTQDRDVHLRSHRQRLFRRFVRMGSLIQPTSRKSRVSNRIFFSRTRSLELKCLTIWMREPKPKKTPKKIDTPTSHQTTKFHDASRVSFVIRIGWQFSPVLDCSRR